MPLSESELQARVRRTMASNVQIAGEAPLLQAPPVVSAAEMAGMIDHTLLKPNADGDQVREICRQAIEYSFGAVCINSFWVPFCAALLDGTTVKVATTVGFPLGAMLTEAKAFETERSVATGAREVDMVLNVGALKERRYDVVADDVAAVVRAARVSGAGVIVKVIIEACFLSDEEKVAACLLAQDAGADFVKTSTGFGPSGATTADVALMRRTVGRQMGVKAAGGVRSAADALAMLAAGANRIGTSGGVKIVGELLEAESRR